MPSLLAHTSRKSSHTLRQLAALSAAVAVSLGGLLPVLPAAANTEQDVNNGATDLTASATYTPAGTPTTASDITFTSGTTYSPTTFTVPTSLGVGTLNDLDATQALTINNGTAAADTLTLNGGTNAVAPAGANGGAANDLLFVASGGTLTIANGTNALGVALAAAGNLDVAGTATINSVITGTNGLSKTGAGTLTLGGTNTFSGGVNITSGTLAFGADANLGAAANGITLSGGTLSFTPSAAVTLGGTRVITVGASGGTLNIASTFGTSGGKLAVGTAGQLTGSGPITKTGPGLLSLAAANSTLTGNWSINAGTVEAIAGALGSGAVTLNGGELAVSAGTLSNAVTVASAATIGADNGASTYSGAVTLNAATNIRLGDFYQNVSRNLTISGNLSGSGAITLIGGNGASSTGTGQTLFLNGTNNSGYTAALSIPAGYNVSFGSVGSLTGGAAPTVNTTSLALGGIGVGYDFAATLPSFNNNPGINVPGGVFGINTTLAATTTLNLSTLGGGRMLLGSQSAGTYTATTLTPGVDGIYHLGGGGGTLTISAAVLADNGSATGLVVGDARGNGNGTVVLGTAANTYTGTTTVANGTLSIGAIANAGSPSSIGQPAAANAAITLGTATTNGGLTYTGGTASTDRPFTLNAGGGTVTVSTAATNLTLNGAVTGAGALTKAGPGTLTLASASNTYTGGETILGGTLAPGADNAFSQAATLAIGNNTTSTGNVNFGSFNATIGGLSVTPNSATANTFTIAAGKTLTVNGNVLFGASANSTTTNTVFTGGGTLAVSKSGGSFQVGGATASSTANASTVDMTALAAFTADMGSTGTFRVGDNNASGTNGSASASTLKLAPSSTIKANLLGVSDNTGQIATQTLTLGTGANVINANTILVAGTPGGTLSMRGNGVVNFSATSPNATITITGYNGAGTTADLSIANTNTNTSANSNVTGTVDFTGHVATLSLGNVILAQRLQQGAGASTTGSLTIDKAASLVTMNTLLAGARSGTTTSASTNTSGTLTVIDGTVGIGTLVAPTASAGAVRLGDSNPTSGTTAGTATGTLQINGGAVTVGANATSGNAITLANSLLANNTATGIINLTGAGSLTSQGNIVLGSATGLIGPTTGVTLNGPTAVLDLTGHNIGTAAAQVPVVSFLQGTVQNLGLINGSGTAAANGITKTGTATLTLAGTDTYTGPTAVNAGILLVNGSHTGAGAYSIASAATLGGTGSIALAAPSTAVTVTSGGTLAPGSGSAPGSLTISGASGNTGDAVTLASGSNFKVFLTHAAASELFVNNGNITLAGANLVLQQDGSLQGGETFTIIDPPGSINGQFAGGPSGTSNGIPYTLSYNTASSPETVTLTVGAVPEPAGLGLLGAGALGLLARRRRPARRA